MADHPSSCSHLLSTITRAYAKINLGLHVLGRRADGYHDIRTVFHRIDLYDEIRLEPCPDIEMVSSSPDAPGDSTNLCFRAAHTLQERLGEPGGVRIHLKKTIPVGAGLGGGSSDAAAVLRVLPMFWKRTVDPGQLKALALRIGSDVPYFLEPGSAVAGGRGEELEYFTLDLPFAVLLCHPGIPISTAWAYERVRPSASAPDLRAVLERGLGDPAYLRAELRNDFEETIIHHHPSIGWIRDAMLAGEAVFASLSGSGSALFGLYADPAAAHRTAEVLQQRGYRTWITPPRFHPPVW